MHSTGSRRKKVFIFVKGNALLCFGFGGAAPDKQRARICIE